MVIILESITLKLKGKPGHLLLCIRSPDWLMLTTAEIYGCFFLIALPWAQQRMIFALPNSLITSSPPIYTTSKCQQAKAVHYTLLLFIYCIIAAQRSGGIVRLRNEMGFQPIITTYIHLLPPWQPTTCNLLGPCMFTACTLSSYITPNSPWYTRNPSPHTFHTHRTKFQALPHVTGCSGGTINQ